MEPLNISQIVIFSSIAVFYWFRGRLTIHRKDTDFIKLPPGFSLIFGRSKYVIPDLKVIPTKSIGGQLFGIFLMLAVIRGIILKQGGGDVMMTICYSLYFAAGLMTFVFYLILRYKPTEAEINPHPPVKVQIKIQTLVNEEMNTVEQSLMIIYPKLGFGQPSDQPPVAEIKTFSRFSTLKNPAKYQPKKYKDFDATIAREVGFWVAGAPAMIIMVGGMSLSLIIVTFIDSWVLISTMFASPILALIIGLSIISYWKIWAMEHGIALEDLYSQKPNMKKVFSFPPANSIFEQWDFTPFHHEANAIFNMLARFFQRQIKKEKVSEQVQLGSPRISLQAAIKTGYRLAYRLSILFIVGFPIIGFMLFMWVSPPEETEALFIFIFLMGGLVGGLLAFSTMITYWKIWAVGQGFTIEELSTESATLGEGKHFFPGAQSTLYEQSGFKPLYPQITQIFDWYAARYEKNNPPTTRLGSRDKFEAALGKVPDVEPDTEDRL